MVLVVGGSLLVTSEWFIRNGRGGSPRGGNALMRELLTFLVVRVPSWLRAWRWRRQLVAMSPRWLFEWKKTRQSAAED